MMVTGSSVAYVGATDHVPLPLAKNQNRRHPLRSHAPTVRTTGLDCASLQPSCKGCGCRSMDIGSAGMCPGCLAPEPAKATPAPSPKAKPKRPTRRAERARRSAASTAERAERNTKIIAAYLAGQTAPSIAADLGMSHPTVYQALRDAGVTLRNDKATARRQRGVYGEVAEQMVADYHSGLRVAELAEKYNLGRVTVRRALDRNGVQRVDERKLGSGGRRREYDEATVQEVTRLYTDERLSRAAVADQLGLAYKTVVTIMSHANVPARQKQGGRADGAVSLRDQIADLGVTPRQIKEWAIAQRLLLENGPGIPPRRVVDAYVAAHTTTEEP